MAYGFIMLGHEPAFSIQHTRWARVKKTAVFNRHNNPVFFLRNEMTGIDNE